jgi:hypothetical protein
MHLTIEGSARVTNRTELVPFQKQHSVVFSVKQNELFF